jgi:hypothetical protein
MKPSIKLFMTACIVFACSGAFAQATGSGAANGNSSPNGTTGGAIQQPTQGTMQNNTTSTKRSSSARTNKMKMQKSSTATKNKTKKNSTAKKDSLR